MRPSEQRRLERQAWVHFVLLCVGAVGLVVIADWVAGHLVDDRWQPELQAEANAESIALQYPQHPARALASSLLETARATRKTLRAERSVKFDGAVLFMKGGFDVVHKVLGEGPNARLVIVTVTTPEANGIASPPVPGQTNDRAARHAAGATAITLGVYQRSSDTWKPIARELHVVHLAQDDEVLLNAETVTLAEAGGGVWAWRFPVDSRCLPAVTSDHATARTVYFQVPESGAPRVLLAHTSDGALGYDEAARASVRLQWEDGAQGGQLHWTTPDSNAEAGTPSTREVPFVFDGQGFALGLSPSSILNEEEHLASAAAREGRADAEARYSALLEAFELVANLEGPLPYCLEMPHRTRLAASVERPRWRDAREERAFRMRLQLAVAMATRGAGREALSTLGLSDPSLVLSSLPQGRVLLSLIAGPRVTQVATHPRVDLRARATYRSINEVGGSAPMLWVGSTVLLVPEPSTPEPVVTRFVPSLSAAAAAGSLGYLRGLSDRFAGRLPKHRLWQGAVRGAALLLTAEDPRAHVPGLVLAARERAQRVVADLATRDRRYAGEQFRRLSVPQNTWSMASWDEMQAYQPYASPFDISPSSSRLVADFGATCKGGYIELCIGFPEQCRELGRTRADLLVPGGSRPTTTAAVTWPSWSVRGCYPGELPTPLERPLRLMGWLADDRLIFEHEGSFLQATIAIAGDVSLTPITWKSLAELPDGEALTWPVHVAGRFSVALDTFGVWLLDQETGKEALVEWWDRLPLGPPEGDWQATLSPNGRYLVLWLEGEGLWIGQLVRLPQ